MSVDLQFVFKNPSFRSVIREEVDDRLHYVVPFRVDEMIKKKLGGHVEVYLRNHDDVKGLVSRVGMDVESKTREMMRKIVDEDPYQNAVFGEFMRSTSARLDKKLEDSFRDKERELAKAQEDLRTFKNKQTWFNFGVLGVITVGVWKMFN